MSVKLRCTATGDLLLLAATADQLLGLLGKQADQPGIIEPADMPAALQVLKNLPTPANGQRDDAASADRAEGDDADPSDAPASFQDETVTLRQRAWPLIQMIERAQSAGKPIVWGV